MKNIPIGEILKESGYISQQQLEEALVKQKKSPGQRLGAILISEGILSEEHLLEALSKRLHTRLVNLNSISVSIDAVDKIPKPLAVKYHLVAVSEKNGSLVVAVNDPLDFYAIEDIRQTTGMNLSIVLAPSQQIAQTIDRYYAEIDAKQAVHEVRVEPDPSVIDAAAEAEASRENEAPVVRLLNSLLVRGFSNNASDLHIEIFEKQTLVRMRIDGTLIEYASLSPVIHPSIIARIKIMSNLDIAENRIPQDGHFKTTIDAMEMNIRVSLIPTVYGEKAVLRFLYTNVHIDNDSTFGMNERNHQKMLTILQRPYGILYLTGPTGSGKTTTLYMALESLIKHNANISTIEDPVERNILRINQMQVNNAAGLTFEKGLRALLRQDPDIIMVGETRDSETAHISVRAAITGHLVLSTMHTNDAISAIVRLEDMGVPRYLIASSLAGVAAQRLLRKVCTNCGYSDTPTEKEKTVIGHDIDTVRRGRGCPVCNGTGYSGRIAVHEIAMMDPTMRKMILQREDPDVIQNYTVREQGMTTLFDNALELVQAGITTVDELLRISPF